MTAEGNVVHDYIIREAIERAIQEGWAATESEVNDDMICQALKLMEQDIKKQPKRFREPKKLKHIISTRKGLGCKHSRHS
ncbi:MAG TPA: hypothetical protein DEG17_00565 [Cyanobacteria bacterium UBA11149]|nr:hypothetical protein [Cyanobacteria bacterium UBA11367]HBE59536.1 hypothetical protein [Cyanobacteria bacterium UBA11366]HBK63866.1 hypothetical protein [Cyanobacteria bacterium UBA11166]HBR75583.1 hypothetical protein [Cyanobacteria bacterium UBA11159]HBS68576.1 hypothetical protein [Cyanobacteria bacterium UBA11153]HBW87410.1 hypothetical protein [Cyanobacteria bacterium UBA11149]HCA93488.1 hypothetical protein [Cyanobacteria bacterium UBA9226]